MTDKESDPNASLFPLFNLTALKNGLPNIPLNINLGQSLLKPKQEEPTSQPSPEVPSEPVVKKRGRKPKKKEVLDSESSQATMKEIIENYQVGVPMTNEVKMKQEKLEKMREGKAKKKELKISGGANPVDVKVTKKEAETLLNMESVASQPQTLFNFKSESDDNIPGPRIVMKDGKPVIEDIVGLDFGTRDNSKLMLMDTSKPHKITSMSFRPKNYTKQWTDEETKKIYKAIEIFGSDFSMMTKLFPTRNRAQIKNKVRKEEKENPEKVEEAFRKHEISHQSKKSVMARIDDLGRKQLKKEGSEPVSLEYLSSMDTVGTKNRGLSTCSLDSMDMNILMDLKKILAQEENHKNLNLHGIPEQFIRELSNEKGLPEQLMRELSGEKGFPEQLLKEITLRDIKGEGKKENIPDINLPPISFKDVKKEEIRQLETDRQQQQANVESLGKDQEGKKPNLLMSMLTKQENI